MASRRQKQFDRKYSSYKKFTATEDVNYSTHSSRSSYRSESQTSRFDSRGRSISSEVIAGSDTRSYPVCIVIQDYQPDANEVEAIALEQGQIVEVLDKKNSARWLVRTKARPPQSGWVPGSYFETPTEYYKQRRKTREIVSPNENMTEEQEALLKRDQVYHDLLRSEEEFVSELRVCVDDYVRMLEDPNAPPAVKAAKDKLHMNIQELFNFHANVMLKGLNYYSDDPGKVGQTFVRLEKDFDHHVQFYKDLPETLNLLEQAPFKEFFQSISDKCEAGSLSFSEHLMNIADRMTHYQNYFKEFVKYSSRAQHNSKSMQKALELTLQVPQRVHDLEYTKNIVDHPGDTNKLGRIIRHDTFNVMEGDSGAKERYVFLFKNKMMITDKEPGEPPKYKHLVSIRLDKYSVRTHTTEQDSIVFRPNEPGLPSFVMRPKDIGQAEYIHKAWMRDIAEEHEAYAVERDAAMTETTTTTTEFDTHMSDGRSEFSEYSGSRKSSLLPGPEEGGPPRKKIKSPPMISPTGSSTSLYSGGSSSIDWTTTGTTLEMQGTRVTRTQYGFRTLQESSAKMCLKVTGYPLPEITWYKDDVLLNEDERHTFYADDDGFFAMTIDPVQVEDTGRYTCMATNEYGQASTSAFFRVLKVEKEAAPPAFVTKLLDKECNEGDVINFECEVEGWPEPELLWLVDDQPLRPSADFKLRYDGQNAKLEIRDAQPDDTGVYTVKIQNEFGTAQSTAELMVQADPDKNHVAPEFQAMIEDVECKEGDEVRFKAVITGDPTPEMVWMINGIPLSESEKVRFISEDGICILTIKDVTRHFDGTVTCQGSNRLGSTTCDARLKVLIPPAAPAFNKPLEDKKVQEKAQAIFEVDVSGWPVPTVTFTLQGKELRNGENGVEIISQEGFHRVIINNCDIAQHDGEIVATASNEHGTAESRARLTVQEVEEESRSAPTFIKDIEDQTVKLGEHAVYETSVSGFPVPEVTWFINGHKMDADTPGVKFEMHNHDHKMTIDSAKYAGTVLCRAENAVGRFETKARLVVVQPETKKPPRFSEELQDKSDVEGSTVVFEAKVEGGPKPEVKWFLNDVELKASERIEIREFDGSIKLELRNVLLTEGGEVKCIASNSEGQAETKAKLTVNRKPFAPAFDQRPQSLTVEQGSEAVFEAHADGVPEPVYQWSIDGRKVRDSTEGARVELRSGVSVLTIDTSVHSASSTIVVVAENSLGCDETGARLTVEPKKTEVVETVVESRSETITVTTEEKTGEIGESEPKETKAEEEKTISSMETTTTEVVEDKTIVNAEQVVLEKAVEEEPKSLETVDVTPVVSAEQGLDVSVEKAEAEKAKIPETVEVKPVTDAEQAVEVPAVEPVGEEPKVPETAEVTPVGDSEQVVDVQVEKAVGEEPKVPENIEVKPVPDSEKVSEVSVEKAVEVTAEPKNSETVTEKMETPTTTIEVTPPTETSSDKVSEVVDTVVETAEKVEETAETVVVTPQEPSPQITRDLKDQNVERGTLGHFEVVAENAKEVHWFHDEKEVTSSTEGVTISQDDKFEFRLSLDTAIFPQGKIRFTASNTSGSVETKCQLSLYEPKETKKPEFTDKLKDMEVVRGESFQCDVIALNSPVFQWTLNGEPMLDGKDGVHILTEGNKSSLAVDKAADQHAGQVAVKASNEIGSEESSAKVSVTEPAKKPEIQALNRVEITEKETTEFKVTISGSPEPQVQWFLNDQKLEQSERINIQHTSNTEFSLTIKETKITESGKVEVRAENSAGSDSKTTELKVNSGEKAPEFSSKLSDETAQEGQPLKVEVKVTEASPGTEVKWYINGKELGENDGVKITNDGNGNFGLEIPKAAEAMSGTLSAKAINKAGEVETEAQLSVVKGNKKPEFAKSPQNHETTIEESVKFSAVVEGEPTPQVTWFLNGKQLENGEAVKVKHEADTGKTSIRIHKPQISDSGEVKVKAENSEGTIEATAELKVERKTEVPKFTTNMDDRQVNEGDTVKYTSVVEGFPEPVVEWTLNGKPVAEFPNIKVSDENAQHTIEIVDVQMDQAGELSCQASNAVGLKKQNVQLAVKMVGEAPMFVKNLEDRLVTEQETTIMDARLKVVKPKPTITWLRDGAEFKADSHWKLEETSDGSLKLAITMTDMADKSRITIKAENAFGCAECTASLGVVKKRPMAKPAFQSDIAPINLTEGDSLQTKLLITGDPTPFVKWYVNGQLVCETEDTEIKSKDGVYSLTIHGVTHDMTGKIKCVAYNKMGEVSTEGPLKVVKPIPVEFETSLCDATCREGDTLKLKAVLLGEPTPVVSWYVNGKKLEETQNIKIHQEKGTYTVTIKDITCDYTGKVVCEAVNEYGKASSEAMLLVLPRGEPPDFIEWLSNVRARQGSKVVHKVVFTGDPTPTLTWFLNNQEVKNSEEFTIVTDDKTSTLTVNNFNPDVHVGEIICKAENDAGEVSCTANMATYTSEQFSESESDAQAEEMIGEDRTDDESLRDEVHRTPTPVMAPKFITKIKDTRAKRGHEAIFECVVPDSKGVCCKWLKDGKEIELIARIRVQSRTVDGNICQELVIDDVQPEDAGKYQVVVENSAGKEICEAALTVLESLEKVSQKAPEFLVKLEDKKVQVSDKVTFECKVTGEPKPNVSWFHEDVKIEQSSTTTIEETSDGIQKLVINSSEVKDEGKYTCIAENEAGKTKSEAKLLVQGQAPEFTQKLQDQMISIGEKLILTCSVKGSPQPHVDFYSFSSSSSTKITSSEKVNIEHDVSNTHWRMVIHKTEKTDISSYRAVATNSSGSATSEAKVTTKTEAPVFEQGLKNKSVKEKEEIKMEVKVSGNEPDVQWFKDGKPVENDANHEIKKDEATGTHTLIVKTANMADAGKYTAKAVNPAGTAESSADTEVVQSFEKPTWVKELTSTDVKISESATISATVTGVPTPEVEWLKDGKPVEIDGQHVIVKKTADGNHTLTVNQARSEDAGKYSAKAVNSAGEAKTEASFGVVKTAQAPAFTEGLRPMEVKETESLQMSVTVVGTPEPKVTWFKDERPVEIDNAHVFSRDEGAGHFVLVIKDARVGDIGQYSCKASNEAGEAKTEAKMGVVEDIKAPHFVDGLKPLEVESGKPAELTCTVEGKPEPEVKWFKDGAPVNLDNQHEIKKDSEGHHTLFIKGISEKDVGSYSCQAVNKGGKDETIADIKIPKYSFEKPRSEEVEPLFIEPLEETSAKEGETVMLACRVNETSHPEIKWFRDDKPVELGPHMQLDVTDDGKIKLTIHSATKEDVGSYRCEAVNKAGKASTVAPFKLKYAASVQDEVTDESATMGEVGELGGIPDSAKVVEDSEKGAPEFIELLRSTTVSIDEQAVLRCKVRGFPVPKIKWSKDAKEVEMSARVKITQTAEGVLTLTIEKATNQDAGEYRCFAENEYGSAWTEGPIIVVAEGAPRPEGDAPDFIQPVRPVVVDEAETAVLEGKVSGAPKPTVNWYKKDTLLQSSDRIKIENLEDGTQRLTVKDTQMSDMDEYRCEASNEFGDVWSDVTLTVKEKMLEAPTFVRELKAVSVKEGDKATFDTKISGLPQPTVKWFRDGTEVIAFSEVKIESQDDGTHSLVIEHTKMEDQGNYRVEATNAAGQLNSKAPLSVSPSATLKIIRELTDVTTQKSTKIRLSVEVEGKPKTVKWYKDNQQISESRTTKLEKVSDEEFQLLIEQSQMTDSGAYRVVLSTESTSVESSCSVVVNDKAEKVHIPTFTKGLTDQQVPKGQKVVLEVEIDGKPKTVKWLKAGKEIPGEDLGNGKYRLVIPDFQDADIGDYCVEAENEVGIVESRAKMTTKPTDDDGKDKSKPEIVSGLVPTNVNQGETATFKVKVNGPVKNVKWYKNGKEIENPKTKDLGDGEHQLEVPNAQENDAADYKVVVSNDAGNAESAAALTVKLPSKTDETSKPEIVSGLVPTNVNQGETATFKVKVKGPVKSVKWYKNGKEIENPKTKDLGDGEYQLEVPNAQEDDAADYKVVLSNDAGSADSFAALTVKLPKPAFIKPLKDQEVTEGEDATFQVETNIRPKTVKWYKNGQELKSDNHMVISGDDTIYKLVIKSTTKDDAAEFKIVLSNESGDTDSSAKLTVKKALIPLCKILKGLEDQVVAKGASLVFEVKVQGEPDDVRWLKDAAPISAGTNALIEKVDQQTYRLTIPKADLGDAGIYTVEVINSGGKATSEAKGEVDEKPEIVKGLNDDQVQEEDDAVFKVEVSAPVRTVKWYKNGQEIKPSGHFETKKISAKKFELAVNKAQLDDGATYKVVLSNAAGECDSSAALTVTKPDKLKILDGLKDCDVTKGEPINLQVKVEGTPKTVKWYKNGQELAPSDDVECKENPATGEYSLVIPASKKSDGAAYRVVLTNENGEVYSGAVAHVKTAKTSSEVGASFVSPLEDQEVEEGDILTLKATVAGEPFPDIKWEKDGVELKKDDRISMRTALDGTVTLRVKDMKKSDIGQYRITATNTTATVTSACAVEVKSVKDADEKPHFVIPLRSSDAAIGDKKEFSVKVRGNPKPQLQWLLNGQPLVMDSRVSVEDMGAGNFCLTIKDVQESDYGTLVCVATNSQGEDKTTAEFSQAKDRLGRLGEDDRYPPRFNVPLWDRRIPVNDPLAIECHVDAKPTAEVEWFKDGVKLSSAENLEIRNTADGGCRLRIQRFTETECGSYKCVATNELGQADTQAIYSVEVYMEEELVERKEFAPKFNPGLEDRSVSGGQQIRLSCAVTALPRAGVLWYKDGLPLRADARTNIEYSEDGQCVLSIEGATEKDEGAYRCVATNEHGSTNTSCLVGVKMPKTEIIKEGEEPFFVRGLVDVWADRGDSFTLKCQVKGDPFPEIKWFRNGGLVRTGVRTVVETSADGTCTLTVNECTMSDEGIYRCEAENKHGKAKTQATTHIEMALGKADKLKLEEGQPPRFIIPLDDQTITLSSIIDLECKVTGTPMPTVKWSKDGGPIWEDVRYEWEIDEVKGVYRLRVKNATLNDEGTYRCVATNESGSATTKAFVRIDDGIGKMETSKTSPPRFTLKLGDARAVEGQPLVLECKVEGSPLPDLVWNKDGAQIHPSDRLQISMSPDGTCRLTIPQCNLDDEGIYRVIATNSAGSAHDKGNAYVKKAPKDTGLGPIESDAFDGNKAPKLLDPLESVKVNEKQSIRLRCRFSGEPKPTIKWFKDGERVFPYGRLELTESADGWCELLISSATRSDAGGYRCVAENIYGSARTTCDAQVIVDRKAPRDESRTRDTGAAPGFTIPLTIRRAKPGQTVTFECLPHGNPFPTCKWLKDGLEVVEESKIKIEAGADGTQRLVLSEITFAAEGFYRCVATNSHGTASTKAELVIDGERPSIGRPTTEINGSGEPEECKPRIRRGLYNQSIHQGNTVEMIVCATGWPTPTVKWFKDGEEIVSDGPDGKRIHFTDERGIHHLVILNSGPEDEGEYSLEATNKLGSARTEGSLNIIRPRGVEGVDLNDRGGMPFPPGFVRQLKNKHVFNHMPTIFDCLVVGYPAPEVEWFHNGKKIVPGGRIKIQSCGGGSHALIMLDTTLEDAGEYVAVAKNSNGTASSSAILDVTVPHLDNIKFNGEIDVSQYLTEEYGFKKMNFASLPTPPDRGPFIKEVTGHYLTLSWIPTKREPPRYPQVSYVIEIRELPDKEWTLLDYNIPEPVCKVRNLELGKSYQFRVRAENIYGISDPSPASPPSRLMAPPQPVFDKRTKKIIPLLDPYAERALDLAHAEQYGCAPWFAPGVVEKRYCAENDSVTIILNVSGYPDPDIQWKFRGWDIDTKSPTSKYKVYTYGGTETTLTITGFTKENVGQYQCFAKNTYGEAQQNIMIELATRPSFLQPLSNKTVSSAQPMKLDVRVDGQPFPEIKWMKDWYPLVESHRVKFVQDGPYLCSLVLNEPMWRDSGVYSCVAINDAGQSTTSCTITVEADGDYNDVELPKKRVAVEARKVREVYEIDEEDEKLAAMGAPFHVRERASGRKFLAQLKPIDDTLKRNVDVHNALEQDNCEQFHTVVKDEAGRLALVVYENATGPLLGSLTHPGVSLSEPKGEDRERIVQIFVRQLLLALEHLHSMKIAHLDLRPESILLQDNKLKLADFGQSRRLLRGLITGRIEGSPEFVSPEIVRSFPLTLATDLWSVGTLTYVLLTGISPFLGDNDKETLKNVDDCRYSVDSPEFADFSWEAKDFIKNLLQEVPIHRLTCEQALMHPWIADGNLKNAPLPAEGLREFNYKHKWLERRVFVQQTPSEQLLAAITAPSAELAEQSRIREKAADPARPREYYDYLRVKPRGPAPVEEIPKRKVEHPPFIDEFGNVIDPKSFDPSIDLTQQIIDRYGPNSRAHPAIDDQPERPNNRQIPQPWDRKGAPRPQEEQQPIRVPLDQYGRLFRPEDLARIPHDQHGRPIDLDDSKFPPLPAEEQYGRSQDQRPPPPDYMPQSEKRKLVPQDKGETPSKTLCRESPRAPAQDSEEPTMQIPLRMIRGERRDIEEEIANRILSDISEEGSLAGSLASIEELENPIKQYRERRLVPRSRSSTPRAESDASTPTLSPVNTVKEGDHFFAEEQSDEEIGDNYKPQSGGLFKVTPGRTIEDPDNPHYQLGEIESLPFDDQQALARLEEDETIPVGAPLFLEGLHGNNLVIDTKDLTPSPRSSAKSPRRCKPGTKSAVILSPGKEHSMEVLIAMKRGKPEFLPPGEQAPAIDDDDAHMDDRKKKVKASKHDSGFRDLRDELGDNNYRKKVENDLDRFRPCHFYKDDAFDRPDYDIDDSPWDSHYQIGPDTYLMAARGPSFNSRVRDYRRNLWGEGAPLVKQGILGVRNMDISVRERRRYTDILRETQQGVEPKSNEHINAVHKAPSASAIERIRADIEKVAPSATKRNADGTYAPIFISRLRDAYLGKSQALFECACTGSPAPSVEWSFQGKSLEPSQHFHVEQSGSIYRLKVDSPAVFDLGEYACVATNEFGTEKTSARLISGETPKRPGRPDAQLSSDTELFLTWDPPEGPCYLEGITYRIEYRPAGSDQVGAPWIVISDSVDDEAVVVKHLEPKGVYQFRVTARNAVGLGLPSLTSRIVQTHHRGVPKLQVDAIKHEIRLNVITLPQRSARQLNEISEESESEQVDVEEKLPTTTVELQNKNPTARFQLESLLFKGKFALIRQAVDIETEGNSQCIAKISDEKQKQSLEEYKLLRDGQHENVQKLIAAYQYDGFMYLFCERLYEDVFARFIFNDYYTEECVSMTIRQLCSAIHWLHFRGIAHLDVNPHNVMFQSKRNWIVKLVDFGSAQRLSEASKPEEFAVEWAAPEFHVQNTPVTVQSDVWGMGVVCFCLLGGFHPFTSEYDRPEEVKDNVLNVKCDPNLIPVCASQESLSFVTWALKKSPLRRMRTDEALSHKFLSTDPSMVRRREAIKYSASRLRKTAMLTKQEWTRPLSDQVEHKFGGPTVQP